LVIPKSTEQFCQNWHSGQYNQSKEDLLFLPVLFECNTVFLWILIIAGLVVNFFTIWVQISIIYWVKQNHIRTIFDPSSDPSDLFDVNDTTKKIYEI